MASSGLCHRFARSPPRGSQRKDDFPGEAPGCHKQCCRGRENAHGFIWFSMVLYVFIWFYNRPLKQDVSKPITCDVTGKKFRISSSSNGDRAVQWWVTSCWRVNLTVKHVGKSWWKLIWVLFATTEREREIILNLLLLSMERDISSTR